MPDNIMTMEAPQPMAVGYQRRSAEFEKLAAALAKAQGAMENAEKGAENPAFKREGKASTYATLGNVWDAIRKPLADNGLSVMQWPRTVDKGVEIETELLHESGQFMRDTLWLPCPTMTVHTIGSTITYGRRYALMSIIGIAPEDDDGNAAAEAHRPGAAGSAGAGTDFRPAGPRRQSSWGEGGKAAVIEDAKRDGLTTASKTPAPINTPAAARNALDHMKWCGEAREAIKNAAGKASLSQWWRDTKEEREGAEEAVPAEYEKVIIAFDARMDSFPKVSA